jgi:molybdate transport system regulatory protein
MKISARNQFAGTVSAVKEGSVMAEVVVKLDAGPEMVAAITRESARRLHLGQGSKVVLIVKATDVIVMTPE